jgi:phosphoglycerate dehydrogenase-like enzyme
MPKS